MPGLISRTSKGLFDVPTLKTLYCSLVRSQLEYSSIVRSPHTRRNIDLIERVQKRATKLILKSDNNYESRLKELNLVSLEQRRFIADVTFLYKVLNGYFNVDFSSFLNFYCPEFFFRSFDYLKLRKNFARTTSFKNSYFDRIVDSWNCLPREVRFSHDLHSFRRGVSGYLGRPQVTFSLSMELPSLVHLSHCT